MGAALCDPTHIALCVGTWLALLSMHGRRRQAHRLMIPLLVVYLPYFLARYHYYGDWLPNPVSVRWAHAPHFEQGVA